MPVSEIGQLVGTVGFPIVACGALFWYINNTQKKFTDALNNNTIVLTKLLTKLGGDKVEN